MEKATINSPLGRISLEGDKDGISSIKFEGETISVSEKIPENLKAAVTQLEAYFSGQRTTFQLRLNPKGTEFQKKVWNELLQIPFGKTTSYQSVANRLGDPKVIRAAASANGKNPIAIIMPCHRIIGSDGSLTGYAGGLQRKKWLLDHESPVKQGELF